ncbi:siderophore-interacting protein [Cryptosporangium phraense]|uniref:Siderophore-interacting protein n=1 Tax=Cryptosporangium phraense TaxID=2593070 RepID=A0A545AEP0_9ACTN|nr:siderophore-interacting protein [Cryptosporangium phraense]TQS39779.1 siderophore-interacting protein [Cryptosporangium phraense]
MTVVVAARVAAVRTVSPSVVRITLSGVGGVCCHGFDQRIKLLFARGGELVLPSGDDWWGSYRAIPEDVRPAMRTFTIRGFGPGADLMDVEFALHGVVGPGAAGHGAAGRGAPGRGGAGPASAWAASAELGSTVGVIAAAAPDAARAATAYEPSGADWQLLAGDETALPAIAAILEALPEPAVARVIVRVPTTADRRELPTPAEDVAVTWLTGRASLAAAVRAMPRPPGVPYAWVAGEAAEVRDVRRYLVNEQGWVARSHYFGGYWRAGRSEDAA